MKVGDSAGAGAEGATRNDTAPGGGIRGLGGALTLWFGDVVGGADAVDPGAEHEAQATEAENDADDQDDHLLVAEPFAATDTQLVGEQGEDHQPDPNDEQDSGGDIGGGT